LELWVALATGLVAAFTTFLGYQQVENTLMKYNQAATNLANVRAWWTALSTEEKADQKNIDSLVGHTEEILASELTGWVQQMQDALAKLRAPTPSEAPEKAAAEQLAQEPSKVATQPSTKAPN
jgi:dipeptidase